MHDQGDSPAERQESGQTDPQTATDGQTVMQSNPKEATRRTTSRQQRDNPGANHTKGDTTGFTTAMTQSPRIPITTTIRDRHDL